MATLTTASKANEILDDEALAEEQLLEELENEEIPAHIREARLQSLKQESQHLHAMKEKQHGLYTEVEEEKNFLDLTTSEDYCVIHFFHSDFRRCAIIDTHLEKLTKKYFGTKFAKINVDKAKFFVEKLKIRVLPAIICFKKGIVCDRIVGFEELGNTDSFQTEVLERRLGKSGVSHVGKYKKGGEDCVTIRHLKGVIEVPEEIEEKKTIFGHAKYRSNEDSDSDDDY